MSILNQPYFHDEAAAFAKLESIVWPDGATCPHCGGREKIYRIKPNPKRKVRMGLHKCGHCKKQFTATVKTIFERSHIPLFKWLQGFYLMAASKKGISSNQLSRTLDITLKSAWFMSHRIREAMKEGSLGRMGGPGVPVQADETYYGHKEGRTHEIARKQKALSAKRVVFSLVSEGRVRSFHLAGANSQSVRETLLANTHPESHLHTDESPLYKAVGKEFGDHKRVLHYRKQYVGPSGETTNAVENYFSVFKRGMRGTYQHCAEKHLQKYINEFDFRYNWRKSSDSDRMSCALAGAPGKRLYYRQPV